MKNSLGTFVAGEVGSDLVFESCYRAMRFRILVLLVVLAALAGCYKSRLPPGTCENDQWAELLSPDKVWKSVLFHRQCGDQPTETNVSVLPAPAALPNEPGNAFRQDSTVEGTRSSHTMHQTWKGPRELWISHDETMKVAFAVSEVGPVRVVHSVGEFHEP